MKYHFFVEFEDLDGFHGRIAGGSRAQQAHEVSKLLDVDCRYDEGAEGFWIYTDTLCNWPFRACMMRQDGQEQDLKRWLSGDVPDATIVVGKKNEKQTEQAVQLAVKVPSRAKLEKYGEKVYDFYAGPETVYKYAGRYWTLGKSKKDKPSLILHECESFAV